MCSTRRWPATPRVRRRPRRCAWPPRRSRAAAAAPRAGGGVRVLVRARHVRLRWPLGHGSRGHGHRGPDRHPHPRPAGGRRHQLRPGQRLRHVGAGAARDGTITVYGHINRSFVQVGQQVAAGDVIAETGNRGQSTGPHLHIGVMAERRLRQPQALAGRARHPLLNGSLVAVLVEGAQCRSLFVTSEPPVGPDSAGRVPTRRRGVSTSRTAQVVPNAGPSAGPSVPQPDG